MPPPLPNRACSLPINTSIFRILSAWKELAILQTILQACLRTPNLISLVGAGYPPESTPGDCLGLALQHCADFGAWGTFVSSKLLTSDAELSQLAGEVRSCLFSSRGRSWQVAASLRPCHSIIRNFDFPKHRSILASLEHMLECCETVKNSLACGIERPASGMCIQSPTRTPRRPRLEWILALLALSAMSHYTYDPDCAKPLSRRAS